MPAAVAVPSIIGAVGSIGGALIGSHAAGSAANTQAQAAAAAGKQVVDATAGANPQIGDAARRAGANVTNVTDWAGGDVLNASGAANGLLNPFTQAGTTAADMLNTKIGDLTKAPTMSDLQIDPGFAFRLSEGQKALANSTAARGGSLSGGAEKALDRYTQADAAQEYAAAQQRYRQQQQDAFSRLSTLAGMGLSAADTQGKNLIGTNEWAGGLKAQASEFGGQLDYGAANAMSANTINAARAQGEYLTEGANAKAAGTVGAANAWNAGITGATGAIDNALIMNQGRGVSPGFATATHPYDPRGAVGYQTPPYLPEPPVPGGTHA